MSDPISRLQLARQEIDRVFGPGYAVEHPELVAVVMQSASSDLRRSSLLVPSSTSAAALVEEEEASGIMQPRELLRVRP